MKTYSQTGLSFVEVLVAVGIVSAMFAGGAYALSAGRSSWYTSEAGIQVQENLRKALDQMTTELRQSKTNKVTITAGGGTGGSDLVIFQVPVICHTGDNFLDTNGDVAHWGATLTWGCRTATCMDADNSCATVDYYKIQYQLIAGNQLVRKVLNNANNSIRQDILASNISNFKANFTGGTNQGIHLDLTVTKQSDLKRSLTMTVGTDIIFRNL